MSENKIPNATQTAAAAGAWARDLSRGLREGLRQMEGLLEAAEADGQAIDANTREALTTAFSLARKTAAACKAFRDQAKGKLDAIQALADAKAEAAQLDAGEDAIQALQAAMDQAQADAKAGPSN